MQTGHIMGHPTDRYIYSVVLIGLLVIFIPTCLYQLSDSIQVRCWSPAHFTGAHEAYVHSYCSWNMTDVDPRSHNASYRKLIYPNLNYFLLAEAVFACLAFLLLKQITSSMAPYVQILNTVRVTQGLGEGRGGSGGDTPRQQLLPYRSPGLAAQLIPQLAQSSGTTCLYLVLQFLVGLTWLIIAMLAAGIQYVPLQNLDPAFMCYFTVRRLGNLHRYTIQCQGPDPTFLSLLIVANIALCIATTCLVALHVLHTIFVQANHDQKYMCRLVDALDLAGVKMTVAGFRYRFSNLYLASLMAHMQAESKSVSVLHEDKQESQLQGYHQPQTVGVQQSKI